ncbi:MAG: MCP four helix bundle domain-containing protein [Myxococcales bacterium]|nr:MCP four helix bundle domain-containing protein [Myxococcales bacterium]
MRSRFSIRGYRAGFLFVVALLAGVAGFTLWSEVRASERVNDLVEQALERAALMATIRVDALLLEQAVEDHIKASTDEERKEADEEMVFILDEIRASSDKYVRELPPGEVELWKRFNGTSESLAKQVRKAAKYSNRKEAERARKHLEEEIKPITWDLDEAASALTKKNNEETKVLLGRLEDLRLRTTALGGVVAVLAVVLALLVGFQVTSVLRRQEKTITDQMAELNRRNQELDAFASRVAHDLVSPLAPLKGYLTLARRSAQAEEQLKELLQQAETSAGRMSDLIEALLRFCRAGKPSEPTLSELDTAVSTILLEVSQSAAAQKINLDRRLEEKVVVACPAQLLQSIAQNLLSNAVKYSAGRPEAKVTVRVFREKGQATLEVTDNGLGMSEESQRQLFQPFFRAAEARALPGHGLGMATTKRLVEAHGGTIQVQSALGAGTQVTIRFPLASAPVGESLARLPEPTAALAREAQ